MVTFLHANKERIVARLNGDLFKISDEALDIDVKNEEGKMEHKHVDLRDVFAVNAVIREFKDNNPTRDEVSFVKVCQLLFDLVTVVYGDAGYPWG